MFPTVSKVYPNAIDAEPTIKCLFFRNEKTGSHTITTLMRKHNIGIVMGHWTWRHVNSAKEFVDSGIIQSPDLESLWKWVVVRNPWERLVSWWSFIIKLRAKHNLGGLNQSFTQWLRANSEHWQQRGQLRFTHYKGEQYVNYIARFENLADDVKKVFLLKLDSPIEDVPVLNTSKHLDYREVWTESDRQYAERWLRPEADTLEYKFGD